MAKQVQVQEESKAYQNLMQKRLIRLLSLCLILWFAVLVKPSFFERQSITNHQKLVWPNLKDWVSFTLSRFGDQPVSIFKKMSSAPTASKTLNYLQNRWFVQGKDRVVRSIDPLLQNRL